MQVKIMKIDICGWWFLVELWFVDVCGTKKSCIESMNNAFSYLFISIIIKIYIFLKIRKISLILITYFILNFRNYKYQVYSIPPMPPTKSTNEIYSIPPSNNYQNTKMDVNDYIYIDQSDVEKIEFDLDDDDYKILPFEYKPLDYDNYEMDEYGNLDLTKPGMYSR